MAGVYIDRLVEHENGNRHRIRHSLSVTGFAMAIADGEALSEAERYLLEAAAVFHDVGIKPALEKYGRADGKAQEELGPAEVRRILTSLDWSDPDIRRIEFLVGHHHTYNRKDDPLLQILIEADFLVNIDEGAFPDQTPEALRDRFFTTPTGIRLFNRLFGEHTANPT